MIQAIMNIVEWLLVLFTVFLTVYPYLSYLYHERTVKNILLENGVGYVEILYLAGRDRLVDVAGTLAIVLTLAGVFPNFAWAVAIWFFQVTVVCHIALKAGHKPGSITYV